MFYTHLPKDAVTSLSQYTTHHPAGETVYHYAEVESKSTLEPDSTHQENQPQYEVPVPQKHIVYKSNEVGKRETV